MKKCLPAALLGASLLAAAAPAGTAQPPLMLPSSKQLLPPVPGHPVRLNSLPMAIAASPDGRYLAVLNAGYGTYESGYAQSIALLDTRSGALGDFPEPRTRPTLPQTLYQGLAFSADGRHLYASLDSLSAPQGEAPGATGNAIAVYSVADGALVPERLMPIPLQKLAAGRAQNDMGRPVPPGSAIPAPAGLAVVRDGKRERLLVADEFSDAALLIDASTGAVVHRFELSSTSRVPSAFPICVAVTPDGRRGFVALWNDSSIVELDLRTGRRVARLALLPPLHAADPGSHPSALALSPDLRTLYVALANRDAVAAVALDGAALTVRALLDTRLPGQKLYGATPDALALAADGTRLYAANAGSDAVAVFDLTRRPDRAAVVHALGFVPTEWYPTALQALGGRLYVATAKGLGTGPNREPQRQVAGVPRSHRAHAYVATLLHGSLATLDARALETDLGALTHEVEVGNLMNAAAEHVRFAGSANPIRHVVYIIKENRTYDQLFGDLGVGDGDPSLTLYGRSVTPNQHKLALQFGVLDNFHDSGEVSGDGHVWSTAAITSDYTEKTWPQAYRGNERLYDFEGVVAGAYPLEQNIADIDEPASGYLWGNLARHGKSLYHFGEFVSSKFCDDSGEAPKDPPAGPASPRCARTHVREGEPLPANYGGGASPWPWPIPLILRNVATKPELVGHFDPEYPDFNLSVPDQLRAAEFLSKFRGWEDARRHGADAMPDFVLLRLPDDHTAGTRPGMPRPGASVADNDLAVGRVVEAVSHGPYWDDTAIFVLEDDAQDGADHVDAHRSIALVVSKYAPRTGRAVVDSAFYTTVSVIRTMEDLLGLPPMNNNDALAPLMSASFAGAGDQPPFDADYSNRDSGFIYQVNSPRAAGARESARMDFSREDRVDSRRLNVILWRDAFGDRPLPAALRRPASGARRADPDD